ncbi:MAG: hypothetical protein ACKVT0_07140 [Planctomycetaceae bacterium]
MTETTEQNVIDEPDFLESSVPRNPRRRHKAIRLIGLWWRIACWRVGLTLRQFPGWTAAAISGGIAVLLSLILLLIHLFWSPVIQVPADPVAGDGSAGTTQDESVVDTVTEGTDDDEPFAVKVHPESSNGDGSQLDMDIATARARVQRPNLEEQFAVTSNVSSVNRDQFPKTNGTGDSGTVDDDSPWKVAGTRTFSEDSRDGESEFSDDLISASKKTDAEGNEIEREPNEQSLEPSLITSSDVVRPSVRSMQEISLILEPVLIEETPSPDHEQPASEKSSTSANGWKIRNIGSSSVDELRIEKKIPDGFSLRKGEVGEDQSLEESGWHFADLPVDGIKILGYQIERSRSAKDDVSPSADHNSTRDLQSVLSTVRMHLTAAVGAVTKVGGSQLKLTWSIPKKIAPGRLFIIDYEVQNVGSVAVPNVRIEADLDERLVHRYGQQIFYRVGTLAPGQKYRCQMFLQSPEPGTRQQQLRLVGGTSVFQEENLPFEVHPE